MAIVAEYNWEDDTFTHYTNGTSAPTPDVGDYEEGLDNLYSFWPGTTPAPAPCPEAVFSLTLKGKLDGQEALLTARGQTAEEFRRNLQSIRGLLDPPQAPTSPAASTAAGWCHVHQVQMQWNEGRNGGKGWWSHRVPDGSWCKGR
jgi:hypothetical protein